MPWIEREGRTVEEARGAAVQAVGLPEDDVEIEVLREGARGLFGLGGETALVRVRPRSEALDVRAAFHDKPQPAPVAAITQDADVEEDRDLVQEAYEAEQAKAYAEEDEPPEEGPSISLGERQQIATDVAVEMVRGILERMGLQGEITNRVAGGTVYVEVFGDDMGILIGRGGKTLEALQELVRAGVQRRVKARAAVVVDVEAYWERRRETGAGRRGGRRDGAGHAARPQGNR